MDRIPVWIDCDPGVDDAAALVLADRLPELEVLGISTVAGNAPLSLTTENALKICDLMEKDYPVYPGADKPLMREYEYGESFHGRDGLGGAKLPAPRREAETLPAWDALYEQAKACGGKLELIALGPLTNVAIALAEHPDLPDYLHRILLMGGSATRGNCTPNAEFNIHADPEAAQIVFHSPVPKAMCGLEVTEQAFLTKEELDRLGEIDRPMPRFFYEATPELLRKNMAVGQGGWCVHDVCPVLYSVKPELFSGREAGVFIETQSELTLGKTVTDLYSDKKFDRGDTLVVLEIERNAFRDILLTAIQAY